MILATRPTSLIFWPICVYHCHDKYDPARILDVKVEEINDWLKKSNISHAYNWVDGESTWHLKNEHDATVFLLRWS
jgi:hypothetical protein